MTVAQLIIFFDGASSVFTWGNISVFIGVILTAGNAVIILRSRSREEAHAQTVRQAAIYKERKEYFEAEWQKEKERAETFETGYKALSGVNIRELLDFTAIKRERDALERECETLQARLIQRKFEGDKNVR
jgi:hypothetical protein